MKHTARIQGRFAPSKQAREYRAKFDAVHAELRLAQENEDAAVALFFYHMRREMEEEKIRKMRPENWPFPVCEFLTFLVVAAFCLQMLVTP